MRGEQLVQFRHGSVLVSVGVFLLWFVFPRFMVRRMIRRAVRARAAELYAVEACGQGMSRAEVAVCRAWIER